MMPILVGFCAAIQANAPTANRVADDEALRFLEALVGDAPTRLLKADGTHKSRPISDNARASALERFAVWASAWLARERVTDAVLFPLTHAAEIPAPANSHPFSD